MAVQSAQKVPAKSAPGTLQERLQQAVRPVVIDVWAPWCGPCRAMAPHLATVGEEYADRVDVWKINADEEPDAVRALKIFGIPTLIVYRDGVEVTRRTGSMTAPGIRSLFETALAADPAAATAPASHAGPTDRQRWLRIALALVLLFVAVYTGWPLVVVAAAAVFFSAIHDRCPIWQGIKARLGWSGAE
jgi:thioredoxin 1